MENQNNIPVNDELIARYLSGEAGPDEAMALHEWLEYPANRSHYEALQAAWHAALPSRQPRSVNVAGAWSVLEKNMERTSPVAENKLWPYLAIAATVALFVAAGIWLFGGQTPSPVSSVTLSTTDSTQQIRLADQTSLVLNRGTTVSYPESFAGEKREVNLVKGEVFFDVASDANKPFFVHTNMADIRVVGTAFNVIVEETRVEVSVKEGRVLVYNEGDSTLVEPGFSAQIAKGDKSITSEPRADVNDWGYATGMFVFKDTPFREVIAKIEKSFPCNVEFGSPNIENCRLTATFENVSAEKMLYLTAETLNLTVERNGRNFTIQGKGCP